MKSNLWNNNKPTPTGTFVATDTQSILGSLRQLGIGRIICHRGPLSLAVSADFRAINPSGHDLTFSGGILEMATKDLRLLVSTASCGLGLGISIFDQQEKLHLVFHFCHGSSWGKWLEHHVASGLLEKHEPKGLAPTDLCWCDLWPQNQAAPFAMPGSLVQKRLSTLSQSRTIETTVHTQHINLSTVIHPTSFDQLASSVRFWDRPRTRVCYADLTCVEPRQHGTYVALES
jgi:hypothetical protein